MRVLTATLVASALTVLAALPALAGGWATVTLDQLPSEFRAGETYRLGYTILQHGMTPFAGAATGIRARSATGQSVSFAAKSDGPAGHYVAEVTFPAAGTWTWEIVPGPFAPQPLAPVEVIVAGSASAPATAALPAAQTALAPSAVPLSTQIMRGSLVVATILAGLTFALQVTALRRRPMAVPAA